MTSIQSCIGFGSFIVAGWIYGVIGEPLNPTIVAHEALDVAASGGIRASSSPHDTLRDGFATRLGHNRSSGGALKAASQIAALPMDFRPIEASREIEYFFSAWVNYAPEEALGYALGALPAETSGKIREVVFAALIESGDRSFLDILLGEADTIRRGMICRVAFSSILQSDPLEAYEFAKRARFPMDSEIVERLFENVSIDKIASFQGVLEELSLSSQRHALATIMKNSAKENFSQALEFVESAEDIDLKGQLYSSLFGEAVKEDPSKVLKLVEAFGDSQKMKVLSSVATEWARSSPEKAAEWALTLSPGHLTTVVRATVAEEIAKRRPELAVELTEKLAYTASGERAAVFDLLAKHWILTDPEKAFVWLEGIESAAERHEATRTAMYTLIEKDFGQAVWMFQKMDIGESHHDVVGALAQVWARRNIEDAYHWATALPEGALKDRAVDEVLNGLASSDPEKAYELMVAGSHQGDGSLYKSLFYEWAQKDENLAVSSAMDTPDPQNRSSALWGVIASQATHSSVKAASTVEEFIDRGLINSTGRGEILDDLLHSWATDDPNAAITWAKSLGDTDWGDGGIDNRRLVATAMDSWGSHDVDGFGDFLLNNRDLDIADTGASIMVSNLWRSDPESAFQWASAIGDPKSRVSKGQYIYDLIDDSRPQLAEKILDATPGFSPEEKELIRNYEIWNESYSQ